MNPGLTSILSQALPTWTRLHTQQTLIIDVILMSCLSLFCGSRFTVSPPFVSTGCYVTLQAILLATARKIVCSLDLT